MLATTAKSDIRAKDTLGTPESREQTGAESSTESSSASMQVPSGLSALIQAATCQLGHLAEAASAAKSEQDALLSVLNSDEGPNSNAMERLDAPERTPAIIPEPDPRKQSFPELLMTLALEPANADTIVFLPDGKFFALRAKEFAEEVMIHYFAVTTFEEFLDLANDWGFSRILQQDPQNIEVFRHPQFIKGDWEKASRIKFGESPTDARLHALPERAKIDYNTSDDSALSKRRLSPGYCARRESETSVSSQKHRKELQVPVLHRKDSDGAESYPTASRSINSHSDEIRSVALAITTEQLQIKHDVKEVPETSSSHADLVDTAVESATHTIVTDAIETLLRDEPHTKETYLKHEKELSTSCLPGVVPISKHLFSPKDNAKDTPPAEVTTEGSRVSPSQDQAKDASSSEPSPQTSPEIKPSTEI